MSFTAESSNSSVATPVWGHIGRFCLDANRRFFMFIARLSISSLFYDITQFCAFPFLQSHPEVKRFGEWQVIYHRIFGTRHSQHTSALKQFTDNQKVVVSRPTAHPSTHLALGQRRLAVDQRATSQAGATAVRKIARSRGNTSLQVCASVESMFCFAQRTRPHLLLKVIACSDL